MWEYMHKTIDNYCCYQEGYTSNGGTNWKHINFLGIERWELVAIRPITDQSSMAIFKRPYIPSDHVTDPNPTDSVYKDLRSDS